MILTEKFERWWIFTVFKTLRKVEVVVASEEESFLGKTFPKDSLPILVCVKILVCVSLWFHNFRSLRERPELPVLLPLVLSLLDETLSVGKKTWHLSLLLSLLDGELSLSSMGHLQCGTVHHWVPPFFWPIECPPCPPSFATEERKKHDSFLVGRGVACDVEDKDESRICRLIQCCIVCEDLGGEVGVGRTKWIHVVCDHTWAVLKSVHNDLRVNKTKKYITEELSYIRLVDIFGSAPFQS